MVRYTHWDLDKFWSFGIIECKRAPANIWGCLNESIEIEGVEGADKFNQVARFICCPYSRLRVPIAPTATAQNVVGGSKPFRYSLGSVTAFVGPWSLDLNGGWPSFCQHEWVGPDYSTPCRNLFYSGSSSEQQVFSQFFGWERKQELFKPPGKESACYTR